MKVILPSWVVKAEGIYTYTEPGRIKKVIEASIRRSDRYTGQNPFPDAFLFCKRKEKVSTIPNNKEWEEIKASIMHCWLGYLSDISQEHHRSKATLFGFFSLDNLDPDLSLKSIFNEHRLSISIKKKWFGRVITIGPQMAEVVLEGSESVTDWHKVWNKPGQWRRFRYLVNLRTREVSIDLNVHTGTSKPE